MINNLDFLTKNTFRNYPLQQGATRIANNGSILPNFVIAGLSLTLPIGAVPYISQVALLGSSIVITIGNGNTSIGVFQASLTNDFQSIELQSFDGVSSGFLITGTLTNIQTINGVYNFNSLLQTGLEISVYNTFTPPAVTKLTCKNKSLTGNIGLGTLNNLTIFNSSNDLDFAVIDNSQILSLADKDSQFMNCDTPVITNINSMVPYPSDGYSDDANIYIFGIDPVVFYNETDNTTYATINAATIDLNLNSFCTLNGTPLAPVNPNYLVNELSGLVIGDNHGYNNYYSKSQTPVVNFIAETAPEYLSWPYFVTTYSDILLTPTNGNYVLVNPTGINGTINKIYAITDTGTVTFTVRITSTNIGGLIGLNATSNGLVVLSTTTNTFGITDTINFNITGTSGAPNSFQLVVFYSQQY